MATPEKTQKAKFIATAKAHGCEDDDDAFKSKLRRIAPAKTEPVAAKKSKKKG